MPVIPINRVVDKKRIIVKNGRLRRRRGTTSRSHLSVGAKEDGV
jgi:hypothetical protein